MYTYQVDVRFTVEQIDEAPDNWGNIVSSRQGIQGTVQAPSHDEACKMVKDTIWAHVGFCWKLTYTQFAIERLPKESESEKLEPNCNDSVKK